MFGYVRPFKSELLVREYDQYKAAYCQLCRALREHYGWAGLLHPELRLHLLRAAGPLPTRRRS